MRIVHVALAAILAFFAALQYDDPDWYYWVPVYLIAAAWSFAAARRLKQLGSSRFVRIGGLICVMLFLASFVALAVNIGPGWIHNEEAREAIGYLICAVATALAILGTRRQTSSVVERGRT
jgi:peptidoglycan/LPS O-acetylase OafA/YrhL